MTMMVLMMINEIRKGGINYCEIEKDEEEEEEKGKKGKRKNDM